MREMYLQVEPVGAGFLDTQHLDAALAACPFPVSESWRCGDWEAVRSGAVLQASGFRIQLDGGPFPSTAMALAAAVEFLEGHAADLLTLSRHPSVAKVELWVPLLDMEARTPRRLKDVAEAVGVEVWLAVV